MKTANKDSLYNRIDQEARAIDLSTFDRPAVLAGDGPSLHLLIQFNPFMQLVLGFLSQWPLLKPSWRAVLRAFATILDGIANGDPTFKAGKDL